jgi:hypothetical protein
VNLGEFPAPPCLQITRVTHRLTTKWFPVELLGNAISKSGKRMKHKYLSHAKGTWVSRCEQGKMALKPDTMSISKGVSVLQRLQPSNLYVE